MQSYTQKSSKKKRYRDRFRAKNDANGMCIMCGSEPQRSTSKLGQACHERAIENRRILKEKRLAEGKCSHCLKRDADKGRMLCGVCCEKKRLSGDKKLERRCRYYGIEVADYRRMLQNQEGVCAICRSEPGGRWNELNIDHCHKTGKVRGLLCGPCNKAIGCFEDDADNLRSAILYLERNNV